jgi:hypothetical protein
MTLLSCDDTEKHGKEQGTIIKNPKPISRRTLLEEKLTDRYFCKYWQS